MAEKVESTTKAPENEELFNSVARGTFVESVEEGFVFEIEEGVRALVARDEYEEDFEEGEAPFEPGEDVELLVEKPVGEYWKASARKAEKLALWDRLADAFENQEAVDGEIVKENKGGLSVDIGLRAFLPRSHVELHRVDETKNYVGEKGQFHIIKFDKKRCNIVVSRRKVLEQEREERRDELISNLEAGQTFDGVVRNITHYGAFVDIGGIDGLVHISNLSWKRINHPSEVVSPGDKLKVVVLEYDEEEERLSLGHKQLKEDPWQRIPRKYSEGDVITGDVVSLADFGAFVEIEDGVEGLVHVTELSWTGRVSHPSAMLNKGEEVDVKIVSIDPEQQRIGLSIKQLEPNPWETFAEEYEVGDVVEGPITNITNFGLFVKVTSDIEGLVHVSDLSWTEQINDPGEHYEEGEEVEAEILEIDVDSQRLGLGIKQLTENPWDEVAEIAKPGEKIDVTITRLTDFGAFAEVHDGIEGLIHISELAKQRIDSPSEVVRPGQEVNALVLKFDPDKRRIGLSLKRDQLEGAGQREYVDEGGLEETTWGDVLGDSLREVSEVSEEDEDAEQTDEAEDGEKE